MNFSELVPYQNAAYSHSGNHLAISKEKNLFVSLPISKFIFKFAKVREGRLLIIRHFIDI